MAKFIALFLAVASLTVAVEDVSSQASTFSLWAFGGNVDGFPVYGIDGTIYAGQPPQSPNDGVNLTFAPDSSDSSKWMVTPSDGSGSKVLYAILTPGEYQAVKYSSSPPQGATTDGWAWMGNQVFHRSNGKMTAQFWARSTGTKKWIIGWNSDNKNSGQAEPVALRRTPPSKTEPPGGNRPRPQKL